MKTYFLSLIFLLSAFCCSAQDAAELFNYSKELMLKGDIKNSVELLKQSAQLGLPEAQYTLGLAYHTGNGVEKNDSIGSAWILKSAAAGWKDARYKIAYNYAEGKGLEKSLEKAYEWIEKCAQLKDPECMYTVSECYKDGVGTPVDTDSVVVWYSRLGKLDNPKDLRSSQYVTLARINLANMYRDGIWVKRNRIKSYAWYLLYNESKKDYDEADQAKNLEALKKFEKTLKESEKRKAIEEAISILGHPLRNFARLHKIES